MAEINSPLGKTKVNTPHRRVYTVEDNSVDSANPSYEDTAEAFLREQDAKRVPLEQIQTRQEMLKEQNRIKPEARKKLEVLLGIARNTKDVEIDGVVFTLQTLKDYEIEELTKLPKLFEEGVLKESVAVEFLFYLRRVTLAYSLVSMDGESIDNVLEVNDFDSKIEAIKLLDNNLTAYLFNIYEQLRDETSAKYSIKNKKEVEEVVESLKK
jgi:hypothetical protein